MRLSFFSRLIRVFWLCVFLCIAASGIGCAQGDSANQKVVATPVVAAEWLGYVPVVALIFAVFTLLFQGFPGNPFVKNEQKTNRKADDEVDQNKKERDYERYENDYRKWLMIKLEKSTIIGMPEGIFDETLEAVYLRDTFVPPHLTVSDIRARNSGVESLDLCRDSGENTNVDSPEKILEDAAKKFRLLLITGEPGAGKTTLLQHFAMLSKLEIPGFGSPIVRYLPLLDMAAQGEELKSLPEKLSESLKSYVRINHSFFEQTLRQGKTLVLLDGLDEICDSEQREKVCSWVAQQAEWYEEAFFVMTTREKGYGEKEQNALRIEKQGSSHILVEAE
jgi:NACHT domain